MPVLLLVPACQSGGVLQPAEALKNLVQVAPVRARKRLPSNPPEAVGEAAVNSAGCTENIVNGQPDVT